MQLSEMQQKILRILLRDDLYQIGGHGRAPWLSAARALVRKGLAATPGASQYYLTDEGQQVARQLQAAEAGEDLKDER